MAAAPRAAEARPESSDLAGAYAHCARMARSRYENFSVVSWLTPPRFRRDLEAVYAFCRATDDLGDEADGDRLALLDEWEAQLNLAYSGEPAHPVMIALQDVVRRAEIPPEPFRKLIQANRIDQGTGRFATYADLLRYCDHSANPVGRMVLHVLGAASEENGRLSDSTCTALQLANFWQDVARDYRIGRVYLPQEDLRAFGCAEERIAEGAADEAFRALMRFEVDRAAALFAEGAPLANRLRGRAKLAVAMFSKGGMRVLDAIREQNYDTLSRRPVVTRPRKAWLALGAALRLAARRPL